MTTNLKKIILARTRAEKRLLLLVIDILLIPLVLWVSLSLNSNNPLLSNEANWLIFALAIFVAIPIFMKLGMYRAVLKYFRSQAIISIVFATALSSFVWVGLLSLFDIADISASVALVYWLGSFTIITITRLSAQHWLYAEHSHKSSGKRVLIYGAGTAGTHLATVVKSDPSFSLIGFIDDDNSLKGWSILGLKVFSSLELERIIEKHSIDEVILAIPSVNRTNRLAILNRLEPLPVHVRSIPDFADLVSGKLSTTDIKDIDIDDLLGRDSIQPDISLLPANIKNKIVLVTGAGGSIGSELCRQIINLAPKKLILLEQSEFALYQIEQELEELNRNNDLNIEFNNVLGSITNPLLLERLFHNKSIQTIYHAAAYKHVPLVEGNPVAGLSNNVFGTKLLAEKALESNVETFILISTDKAVRPTNVMGCSKRISEMVLQALSNKPDCNTVFSMVRFGNVLGSSGSVVPKFRQQIQSGGPITVTHKEITRYFMSIPEAVQLVIQAGAMAEGGDVFVLDMGSSVKISDLATKMIKLSGLSEKNGNNLDGDIEVKYTGLRPGEKLYEELLIGDNVSKTQHPRIMRANEDFLKWKELSTHLHSLEAIMLKDNIFGIKKQLTNFVDGYIPWVDNNNTQQKSIHGITLVK